MLNRTEIKPGQPVPLDLTAAEKSLLAKALLCLEDDLAEAIVGTPSDEPVTLSLDDLDGLADHIAAAANHAEDKQLKKRLDRIFKRIDTLLDSYVEVDAPTSLRIFDPQSADEAAVAAKLRAFASITLFLADARSRNRAADPFHHRSEQNVPLSLTGQQRELLGGLGSLPDKLLARLRWHADASEPMMASINELALLLFALAESIRVAAGVQLGRLEEAAAVLASSLSKALDVGDAHSLQTRRTRKLKKRKNRPTKGSPAGTSTTIRLRLTASQRRVAAELTPELAGRLQLDDRNQRTIELFSAEAELLANLAQSARSNAKNGTQRISLGYLVDALSKAAQACQGVEPNRDAPP